MSVTLRTPTQAKPHGVHAIACQALGNAQRETQLAPLDRVYDVADREGTKDIGHTDLLRVMSGSRSRRNGLPARSASNCLGARDPYRYTKCDSEVGVGLRRSRGRRCATLVQRGLRRALHSSKKIA